MNLTVTILAVIGIGTSVIDRKRRFNTSLQLCASSLLHKPFQSTTYIHLNW